MPANRCALISCCVLLLRTSQKKCLFPAYKKTVGRSVSVLAGAGDSTTPPAASSGIAGRRRNNNLPRHNALHGPRLRLYAPVAPHAAVWKNLSVFTSITSSKAHNHAGQAVRW